MQIKTIKEVIYKVVKHFVLTSQISKSEEESMQALEAFHHNAKLSCIKSTTFVDAKYDLDIIIPVYKTENYIERCLESIIS